MIKGLTITRVALDPMTAGEILATAIEAGQSGIGYWAHVRDVLSSGARVASVLIEDVEGAAEGEEPKRYRIDIDDVRKAVGKMFRDPERCECVGSVTRMMKYEHVDGPLADTIVQVACFGKVIYG